MKKNFKRLLCLVLVVSLVCTLGVTAFAANSNLTGYPDVEDIAYPEAVDVLTGIGILEGDDSGNFNGGEYLTRAQAAKLIAYLALGADAASSLSATNAPFDDVALTHWAVDFIAYCASAGIIDGDGYGSFNPEDYVTAYQFEKMLLCVVGYGANGEFTGVSWNLNVASVAAAVSLASGVTNFSGNEPLTRNGAAKLLFNALVNVAQVSYNANFGEYYVGTSALNSISTTIKGSYQYETYIDDDENDETAYEYTIGYQTYDLTKTDDSTDAFGRPYYVWQSDGDEVSDKYLTDDIDYTITGKATIKDVYNAVGSTAAKYEWVYVVDGVDVDAEDNARYVASIYDNRTDDDTTLVARGQTMEVYITTETNPSTGASYKQAKAVIITDYLAQVSDVDEDGDDIELTLDAYIMSGDADTVTIDSDTASNLANFEEDDWVIITYSREEETVESITAATSVEGVPTAYANSAVTVDGTKYNYSYSFNRTTTNSSGDTVEGYGYDYNEMDTAYDDKNYDDSFILYLDTYGNLIGFEAADDSSSSSVSKNYLYVKSVSPDAYDGFDDAEVKVKVQFTDGTWDTVYLNVTDEDTEEASVKIAGTTYDLWADTETTDYEADDIAAIKNAAQGKIFSYTVNSSGYYTLKSIGTKATQYDYISVDDVSAVKLDSDTKYATSTTKLVLVEDGKTYTGYANFPDDEYDAPVLALYTNTSKTRLTYLYVFGDDASTVDDLVYAVYKGVGDSTSDGTYYEFYVAGSVASYLFDDDDYSSGDFTSYEAGWIEVGSDGYSDFYAYSDYKTTGEYDIDDDDSDETITYAAYKNDYFMYAGVVVSKSSDSIGVDVDGNGTEDFVFALADDYEKTRVKTGSSRSATAASEGDYVWVFTEDEAVSNSMSAEAVAVVAVNNEISGAVTYFTKIGVANYYLTTAE